MNDSKFHHIPVLFHEVLGAIPEGASTIMDLTLGGAGHAKAMLEALPGAKLYASDRDPNAIQAATANLGPLLERAELFHGPFSEAIHHWIEAGVKVDFLLADLGVSSHQLDEGDRGFSFNKPGPLDMRMNPNEGRSAKEFLEEADWKEIAKVLSQYGEEKFAVKIANRIKEHIADLNSTQDLSELIYNTIPRKFHPLKIHPATKSFQAIRIEVNQELEELKTLLKKGHELLNSGGRIAIISFHSLEDRMVKEEFNHLKDPCTCPKTLPMCICHAKPVVKVITRKPITATAAEETENPRARSAKFRVAEKI